MTKDEAIEKIRQLSPEAAAVILSAFKRGDRRFTCKKEVATELRAAGFAVPTVTEFLELTPIEYRREEWRRCSRYTAMIYAGFPEIDLENGLTEQEERFFEFGFFCYQAGWSHGFDLKGVQ